jgi:hypothetical protein
MENRNIRSEGASRCRGNNWLCYGGPASDSGLYLKLVRRVYLIEKAGFWWYCLLRFLRIQVAKRPFTVSFRERWPMPLSILRRNLLIRINGENYVVFCSIRDDGRGFDRSQATHGRKGLGLMAI